MRKNRYSRSKNQIFLTIHLIKDLLIEPLDSQNLKLDALGEKIFSK